MGGNTEQLGVLDRIDQYLINYDRWDTLNLKLKHKIQDFQIYPLKDSRVLILGGKHEDQQGKCYDVMDFKPYVLEELKQLNRNHSFKEPMFGITIKLENRVAFVKNYCDSEPTVESFMAFDYNILNEF